MVGLDNPSEPLVVLGGSFDPPHLGHLLLASLAGEAVGAANVLLMPASSAPGKAPPIASASDRMAMLQAACKVDWSPGEVRLTPSSVELDRGGVSYTIDTVEALATGGRDVVWVVGSDQITRIKHWHRWRDLVWACRFAVAQRAGDETNWQHVLAEELGSDAAVGCIAAVVDMPPVGISSTVIRSRIANSQSVRWMLPLGVLAVIQTKALYRNR